MKEFTKEELTNVARELNEKLQLSPPIVSDFTATAKGAAAKSQEKKFLKGLAAEITDLLAEQSEPEEMKDVEGNLVLDEEGNARMTESVYLVQPGDIPLMAKETQKVLKELAADQKERLFPGKVKKERVKKEKKEKKTWYESMVRAFLEIDNRKNISQIVDRANEIFQNPKLPFVVDGQSFKTINRIFDIIDGMGFEIVKRENKQT